MKQLALALFMLLCITLVAQEAKTLTPKTKASNSIGGKEKHTYKLSLKKDQFAVVNVMQDGIDLAIQTSTPAGKPMEGFDSPNGKNGPELFWVVSTEAGEYNIDVMPLESGSANGNYTIEVLRVEAKASTPEKQIDQYMSVVVKPGEPGATIAVAKGTNLLLSKAYGLSNPEYNIPNTPSTIFHVASVSKQFTAFAIALLADQGKISLDDDIRKYLPELHDFGQKITIKHLVFHTSGLRDQWNLLALAGWRLDDVITKNQVLRLMFNQKELNTKPGEEFNYCNTGYTFLAEIVSRVSGKSFGDWTQENIFKPLQMNNTLFYEDHERIVNNRSYSFHQSADGLKKSVLSYANAGATSLFTTSEDLMKWADNFRTMKVGNANVMKQMNERGILNKGDTLGYAFGQGIGKWNGLKRIEHGGADAGYRTNLMRFPDQQIYIAVLSNMASFNPGGISNKIADLYLKDYIKKEPEKAEERKQEATTAAVAVPPELLKKYEGDYELQPGFIINMKVTDGKLVAQATRQPAFELVPRSNVEFDIPTVGAKFLFPENAETVNEVTLKQGGQTFTLKRQKPFDAGAVDLAAYTGRFYSPELETSYLFVLKDGKLVAKHIRHDQAELTPTSKDTFSSNAWYMGKIDFTRNEKNEISGLKVSSGRVKNVKFVKVKEPEYGGTF